MGDRVRGVCFNDDPGQISGYSYWVKLKSVVSCKRVACNLGAAYWYA